MKILVYGLKTYEKKFLEQANINCGYELHFTNENLNSNTISLAKDFKVICCFVHDELNATNLKILKQSGVELIALRSAGFDHVDINAAQQLALKIVRVPAYSPNAVAEFATALILALNRKISLAIENVKRYDFRLDNLIGFDLNQKKVAIIGTGKIGAVFARIMHGFGCKLFAYDVIENNQCIDLGVQYETLENVVKEADIVSLHCALTPQTKHIINEETIQHMKPGVMLINTGRGALVDTNAVLNSLKKGKIGYFGFDVYEHEKDLFYRDLSQTNVRDPLFSELIAQPNVIASGHQAYLTKEALENIAKTTFKNITSFIDNQPLVNEVNAIVKF